MCNTDGRRSLVDVLTTGTTGTIGIDPQVIRVNVHIQIFLNIRHNITGHERGLAFSGRIERGNTHQTVHATFGL